MSRPVRLLIVLALAAGTIALAVALTGGGDSAQPPSAVTRRAPADFVGIIPPGIASMKRVTLGFWKSMPIPVCRRMLDLRRRWRGPTCRSLGQLNGYWPTRCARN